MSSSIATPVVVGPDGGTVVESFSPIRTMIATPGLSLCEQVLRPGGEPPMHVHANEDELFYVLDGRLTIHVDGAAHDAPAGACALLPRNIPHTFAVASESARVLLVCVPGGFEGMFADIPAPVDMDVAMAAFERYGITITGPNPGP